MGKDRINVETDITLQRKEQPAFGTEGNQACTQREVEVFNKIYNEIFKKRTSILCLLILMILMRV